VIEKLKKVLESIGTFTVRAKNFVERRSAMIRKVIVLFTCFVVLTLLIDRSAFPSSKKGETKGSGRLFVVIKDGNYGYIDRAGKVVIQLKFDEARDFHEGLAAIKTGLRWGYIDRVGKFVVNPQFDSAGDFHEGLGAVKMKGRYGYIDNRGKMVINPQFEEALDFYEGLARVKVGNKWGYIDRKGKFVWDPTD